MPVTTQNGRSQIGCRASYNKKKIGGLRQKGHIIYLWETPLVLFIGHVVAKPSFILSLL